MDHELRLRIFWIVHPLFLGLFVVELGLILSVWLKATVPGLPANASRLRKLGAVIRFVLGLVCSHRLGILLKALVLDGMVHRRLFRTSRRRWMAHVFVFGAFLMLGILSTVTGFVVEVLPLMGMHPVQIASIPLLGQLYHADVWWVALLNELLGLVVLAGMCMVIYRRYIQRDPRLRTAAMDTIIIALLVLIAVSGYPTETFRLLADYTTATGAFAPSPTMLSPERFPLPLRAVWGPQYGFVGYLGALILGALNWSRELWQVMHNVAFWLHVVLGTALLYLLPFSRFAHAIASPVVVAYSSMLRQEAQRKPQRLIPGMPQPEAPS